MDKEIETLMEIEISEIKNKFAKLSALCTRLEINDIDRIKDILDFADLFRECNKHGWIEFK